MAKSWFDRNKSWAIPVGIVVLLGLFLIMWFVGSYNSLIITREDVNTQWANVETQYQRRADLIPNLVETVAAFAAQEEEVFLGVTEARSRVGQVTPSPTDANSLAEYQSAQSELGSAISRLLLVVENYPQLKSDQNFLALQDQLEGTENRIAVARRDYNTAVRTYNIMTQRIPTVIIANMFGFDKAAFFDADEGTADVPTVTKEQFA